jgi:hypothetical protein
MSGKAGEQTILEAAVAQGLALQDPEAIGLHQQVGGLEIRNACLENAIEAISRNCAWRLRGLCNLACEGYGFCKTDSLVLVAPWRDC